MPNNNIARSYNSFSGVDIKAVFGEQVIGELQAISYSVSREKAPIYTMGSVDPRAFSRGKRGIAGTLVFIMFDRAALLGTFGVFSDEPGSRKGFSADKEEADAIAAVRGAEANISEGIQASQQLLIAASLNGELPIENIGDDQVIAAPWYADQIPPFDVTLAGANEYGALAVMRILQLEILNEGYGVSIDDMVSESQMSYVARAVIPWQKIANEERSNRVGTSNVDA